MFTGKVLYNEVMSDAIIVGLFGLVGSVLVAAISSLSNRRETSATIAAHEQKQQDIIDDLKREIIEMKKRLDSHNGYAEKFAESSKDTALMKKDIEYIKDQIKNLPICRVK